MAKSKNTSSTETFETDELLALARLDMDRGHVESALAKLKQILAGSEPPADAQAMAAKIYAQLGLFDRARLLFQSYLQSHPRAVNEKFQLGMTHFDGQQPTEALRIWDGLLKEFPTHPPSLFYKALVLAQQGKGADAKQALDILLKSVPADNLYFGRGTELLQSLNHGKGLGPTATNSASQLSVMPHDAYKTEH